MIQPRFFQRRSMTLRFCFLFHTTNGRSAPDAILQVYPHTPYLLLLTRAINTIFTSLSVVNKRSLPVCTFVPLLLALTNFGAMVFTPTVLVSEWY